MTEPREKATTLETSDLAYWGCVLGSVSGAALLLLGVWMLFTGSGPGPLRIALIIVGVANALLGYRALLGSRVAWAFLTASCGTLSLILLFGAPKVRDLTSLSLGAAALPFIFFAVATTLLAFRAGEYD